MVEQNKVDKLMETRNGKYNLDLYLFVYRLLSLSIEQESIHGVAIEEIYTFLHSEKLLTAKSDT